MQISATTVIQCIATPFRAIGSAIARAFRGICNGASPRRTEGPINRMPAEASSPVGPNLLVAKNLDCKLPGTSLMREGQETGAVPLEQLLGEPSDRDLRVTVTSALRGRAGCTAEMHEGRKIAAEPDVVDDQTLSPPSAATLRNTSETSRPGSEILKQVVADLRRAEDELLPARYRASPGSGTRPTKSEALQIKASEDVRFTRIAVEKDDDASVAEARCHLADILKSDGFKGLPKSREVEPRLQHCLQRLSGASEGMIHPVSLASDASTTRLDVLKAAFKDLQSVQFKLELSCHVHTVDAVGEAGAEFSGAAWYSNAGESDVAAGKISRGMESLSSALAQSRDFGGAVTPALERIQANLLKFV